MTSNLILIITFISFMLLIFDSFLWYKIGYKKGEKDVSDFFHYELEKIADSLTSDIEKSKKETDKGAD